MDHCGTPPLDRRKERKQTQAACGAAGLSVRFGLSVTGIHRTPLREQSEGRDGCSDHRARAAHPTAAAAHPSPPTRIRRAAFPAGTLLRVLSPFHTRANGAPLSQNTAWDPEGTPSRSCKKLEFASALQCKGGCCALADQTTAFAPAHVPPDLESTKL